MKTIKQEYIELNKEAKRELIPFYFFIISLFILISIYSYIIMPKLNEIVNVSNWEVNSYFLYNLTLLFKENIFYVGLTILSFIFLTYNNCNKKINIQD